MPTLPGEFELKTMSHLSPGLLSAYNSLTDRHLAGYFSNTRIRRHLQRAGLITRSGRIVPDKEYRHKLVQRAHQRHIRECLAQAIFHKVLEMERVHQIEIKRKLEEFARRERVHKIKVERSKRYEEDIIRILSPRPPTGARCIRKQHSGPEGEHSESSESPGSSRPNTAPGKMQRPVRLKPIHSNSTTASLRRSSPHRLLESSNENDQPFNCTMDKASRRRLTTTEVSRGISPYCLPVINNFVTPVPPSTKRKERGVKVAPSGTLRGRRLRPTTSSSGADLNEDPPMLRSSVHQSGVCVNMMYFGKTVHLSHDLTDMRDEVKVFQQHCGGENLCVFKGKLREGETFQFTSRRHRGFPFSLTFFLNGLQVERLSSCCEFKHRKGPRLGGRHGHFGFCSVEGASPCYKCIIAMGLDKKPSPPPKRVKEDECREESVTSHKDAPEMETERTGDDAASHSECETSQPQDAEAQVKEETAAEEDKVRDDYEEDFEVDDEGPPGDVEAKEKKSSSPSGETTERQVTERDASETEDDEKDEDIKSHSGSSSSGSDREESDAESTKDSIEGEKPKEVDREETVVPPDEKKDEPHPEEAAAAEAEPAVPKDSDIQDSTEIEVYDTGVPSGNENKQSEDTLGDKEVDENQQEEEQERAKSVQEKLAEAILKESQCSSEPELSDTSTEEEEEESTDKGPEKDGEDAVAVEPVTFTEQQPTLEEETKCEEGVVGEAEVAKDHDEPSEPKDRENETEQEPQESSDSTKDEKVKTEEEADEKASSEEDKNTAENDKPEHTEDTALRSVSEEEITDGEAAGKDEEKEEKTAAEDDETGQGTKSGEEDESSVSEPNKKTDETAAPDNAEAMTASETMEMKAEPSEEREALNYEEAPVTDTETRPRGDSEDRDAASETEVTAENSRSSSEESGDTTVHKTADSSAIDVGSKDGIKEEEVSAVEDSKDDNQQHRGELGEEQAEKSSVVIDDEVEEKCEEEEKQTNPDEKTEGETREESEKEDKDETEEEKNDESKTEERIENKENISEGTKSDSEGNANEEQAEEHHSEEEVKVANEEKADTSEKTEGDEDGDCVENKNGEEDSEEKGAATDKTNECEEMNSAVDEEKNDEAEKEEKDQNEDKAENKEDEECEEKKVVTDETTEGEEISEIPEESEKCGDADLDKDNMNIPEENIAESEDVTDTEAANVAQGTKAAEEKPNNAMEAEDVMKETEGENDNSEKGEVDVENGEISHEDEGEAQTEGKDDVKTAVNTEEGRQTEEPTEGESTEAEEVTVESGDAEKYEDDKVDEAPDADVVQSEAEDGNDGVEKQEESSKNDSEPETSGTQVKGESKSDDGEDGETKQDEDGNISDPKSDNADSDLMQKSDNVQSDVSEVIAASAVDQAQSSAPTAVDSDDTPHQLDESTAPSDSMTDKHPHADENAAAADLSADLSTDISADLSAADGDNGADTEEASKASEEGASVLLKPQALSSQLTQNNDNAEESVAAGNNPPEALAREDNTDLVTNWVTTHQTSKYFETFVDPLEDLKESTSDDQVSNSEETAQSAELPRSASPLKMAKVSENAEQEHTAEDVNESGDKSKEETAVSNPGSNHSEDGEPQERDTLKVEEETEVKDLTPETESEQNKESVSGQDMRSEEHKGSRGSLEEDKVQEGLMQDNSEQTDIAKTEVESIAGTHHSVTSGRLESVSENQTEEKTTDNSPEKQTAVEEVKDLLPSSKTEEHHEYSTSPEGLSSLKANEPNDSEETWGKSDEQSREVTEITDFTTSKSDDGSQEESQHRDMPKPKSSDGSVNGDKRDVQLIQDIKHTLSKDRLSTFSVDETMFGRSSYPLLTAARTESGH